MKAGFLDIGGGVSLRYGEAGLRPDNAARVLLLQGRAEFLEKYDEVVGRLAGRGLGVVGFDWRGQGLSSRLLSNPQKGHIPSYDDYLLDVESILTRVLTPGWDGPVVMIAHSMGANIGLRSLVRNPANFDAAVFVAPMWRLPLSGLGTLFARSYSGLAVVLGLGGFYAPFRRDYDSRKDRFEANPLTSSRHRFERSKALKADNPGLRLGGPTLGWIAASLRSARALEGEIAGAPPSIPILILSPEDDRVVDKISHRAIAARMPNAEIASFPGARHELLMEADDHLDAAFAAIDRHLAKVVSPG